MRTMMPCLKSSIAAAVALLVLVAAPPSQAAGVSPADIQDINALFLRQAAAEDVKAMDAVLAHVAPGQPDPVTFVAPGHSFWGREAVLEHFRAAFAGTWRFEPDQSAIRVIPLGADVAQIYAPTRVTRELLVRPARPTNS